MTFNINVDILRAVVMLKRSVHQGDLTMLFVCQHKTLEAKLIELKERHKSTITIGGFNTLLSVTVRSRKTVYELLILEKID